MANTTAERMKEYENKVVASIIYDEGVRQYAMDEEIDTRIFYIPLNEKIMRAFSSLRNAQREPNVELIIASQEPKGNEEEAWRKYFEEMKNQVVDLNTVLTYIEMLKKQYKIKRYEEFADKLKDIVHSEKISPIAADFDEMDKEIDYEFAALLEEYRQNDRKDVNMAQGIELVLENLNDSLHSDNKEMSSTGYEEVDNLYNGGHLKGTYSIYAGRPGAGKTVLMINEAVEAALEGQQTLFISIEMNSIQCFQRIVAKLAGIDGGKLQNPQEMTTEDWKKLKKASQDVVKLFDNKFWIIEVTEMNNPRLRRIIQDYKKKHGIDAVYLDYIQIMSTEKGEKPEFESDYGAISEGLRKTSKGENIALVVGSQLSRDVEKRDDKRPKLSDLRNSGTLEQDAARVVGIYRDEYYNKETEEPGVMEYIVLKNRFGATKTIKLKYDAPRQNILSMV